MHRKLIYQSILNTTEPRPALPDEVTSDLRLDTLLRGRAAEIIRRPAAPCDLPLRQALFRFCENGRLRARLGELRASLDRIERLFQRLDTTECEDERNVLTVCIFKAELEFLGMGARLCQGADAPEDSGSSDGTSCAELLSRFSEHCAALLDDDNTAALSDELSGLRHGAGTVYRCEATAQTAYLSLAGGDDTDIYSRLRTLASSLGISIGSAGEERHYSPLGEGFISTFALLDRACYDGCAHFAQRHSAELDRSILEYIPELDCLISIGELTERVRAAGIPLCFPVFSEGEISVSSAYDITLLEKQESGIIPNDITFTNRDRIFYLTGANGGGKTTYLRTVGNLVLLALSGAVVPARSAELPMLDAVYTHFPRDERFGGGGRFSDEETRADEIAENADAGSLVLLNETFSTTGEEKAKLYTARLAHTLFERGCYCIYVTHQKPKDTEIPVLGVVLAEDGEGRTYKIRRIDGSGGSHALDILKKYRLDRDSLAERFGKK